MIENTLGNKTFELVRKATAVFPENQRDGLDLRIVSLVHSKDPSGFPQRLSDKVLNLPGQHLVGVEMLYLTLGEAAEEFGQEVAAGLGNAGLLFAFIVAKPETLDLLFPDLIGQNRGFASL